MKLHTIAEIAPQIAELFGVHLTPETMTPFEGRQYVCTPQEYVDNCLGGAWSPDVLTANQYLQHRTFMFNADRPLEDATKRFVVYRAEVETVSLEEGGIKLKGMSVVLEFNTVDELKSILKEHEFLIKNGLSYVLFDVMNLQNAGYGAVDEQSLVTVAHQILG